MIRRLRKLTTTRPEWQKGIDNMSETNKPSTRDLFAEWARAMLGDNGQSDEPAKGTPESENRPSPIGDAENYSPTPTRDLFAMTANEALSNGFNDDSGLWRNIL